MLSTSEALNTRGVARRLGCLETAIQQFVEAGELKAYRADGQGMLREYKPGEKQEELYFSVSEVERLLFHPRNPGWFPLREDQEPNPPEASEVLLGRVRSMAETWQRLGADATSACYRPGRLSLLIEINDDGGRAALADLRIDHLGTVISAAWVSDLQDRGGSDIEQVNPQDRISIAVVPGDPTSGIDEAISWLEAQLRRPIQYFEWTRDGTKIAELYLLTDTGRGLVVSGSPQIWRDSRTADSVRQIRP